MFQTDRTKPATLARRTDHIEAAVAGPGDVRLADDNVFAPCEGEGGKLEGAKVSVINADRWKKSFTADANGRIDVPVSAPGRYLVSASHTV